MNVHKSVLYALLIFAVLTLPTPTLAVQGGMFANVTGLFVNSTPLPAPATTGLMYGGCMALLSSPINKATNSPNCPDNYVSFSCDGTYTTQAIAQTMYDQAQLALALNKQVYVKVDDTMLSNGFCTAVLIELLN